MFILPSLPPISSVLPSFTHGRATFTLSDIHLTSAVQAGALVRKVQSKDDLASLKKKKRGGVGGGCSLQRITGDYCEAGLPRGRSYQRETKGEDIVWL